MKRLLYSSLMALMMLFAIGSANAQKVTIKLGSGNVPTWTLGSDDVLNFVITITENEGEGVTPIALGSEAGQFAVKVGFVANADQAEWSNVIATHTQVLTQETTALVTTTFTEVAEYKVVYKLVKGDDNDADFEGTHTMGSNTGYFDVVAPADPYRIVFESGLYPGMDIDDAEAFPVALNYPSFNMMAYEGEGTRTLANAEIYYMFLADGETTTVEPTREAYNAEGNTKVKKAAEMPGMWGQVSYVIYTDDATAKTIKIKGYLSHREQQGGGDWDLSVQADGDETETAQEFETATQTFTLSFPETKATTPIFNPAPADGEVELGDNIKISNFLAICGEEDNWGERPGEIYYTTNGTTPLYGYQMIDPESGILPYSDEDGIAVDATGNEFTIKAVAFVRDEETGNMTVSDMATATYTIKAADEPAANYFTFTPAPSAEGLEAGTQINIAWSGDVYDIIKYKWFADKATAEADETKELEAAGWTEYATQNESSIPVFAAANPVIKVLAFNDDEEFLGDTIVVYTVKQTPVGPEKLDVKIDFMTDAYGQARFAKKSDKIRLVPENYDYDALDTMMYAIVTVTDEEESEATYVGYTEELISLTDVEGNFRVKAYGKKGDKTTDVYSADFVLLDIINPTLSFDTATGKNYPVAFNVTSISYPDIMDKDMYVYYSLDGTTEPSDTAFLNGNEALKYINREDGQWKTFLELKENTTIWAKAYVMVDNDAEIVLETPAVKQLVKVNSLPNPVITPAVAATEYNAGDSIKVAIQMPEDAEYDYVYYTLDGSDPLYSRLVENEELFDSVIFVYEPWFENFDTIVVKKSTTIKAIAYKEAAYRPFVPAAGSDIVSATFGFKAELTFDPASGSEVYEGTRVAINSADETIDIYYMMFESEEAAKAAEWDQEKAALYTSEMQPVISKKNTTIKAAYLHTGAAAVTGSYCYATYTVKERPAVTLTLDPADGAEVEANTKVTVTASRELLEGEDIIFVMFADKKAADTCSDMDMVMNGIYYGEPDEAGEYGYPVITKDAPVLKVGVLGAMDENGNFTYNWIIAEYKIKGEGPVQANEAGELAGVNVYPNPSNGTFNVAVPEKARIDIFGLNGAKVMSREANAGVESFSINHSGIYFVRVMAGNKAAVKRVVVR